MFDYATGKRLVEVRSGPGCRILFGAKRAYYRCGHAALARSLFSLREEFMMVPPFETSCFSLPREMVCARSVPGEWHVRYHLLPVS